MKYFIAFTLCIAAASAFVIPPSALPAQAAELQQIIDAIYHPSTDPATAAALEQMLQEILGVHPTPIEVKPEIVDDAIIVEPGHNEELTPIEIGPAIIDQSIVSEPANYRPPLVQVIINVNTDAPANAVVVEQPEKPNPRPELPEEVVVAPIIIPEPVIVAPVIVPEPVIVAPIEVPQPAEPVIVAPIEANPAVNLPGTLN